MNNLLQYLNKAFPNILPDHELTAYELGVLVGQQEVVSKIIQKAKLEDKKLEDK
ncbi:MAG: hypothetical protein J7M03_05470 [Candidatus Desulfofervidaceae bacterium]|nr:hypothetical protein [Candidatus Desulfofervidaceae bacterium]